MPDSTSPFSWGSASFDDRDLDDLLSGQLADTPPPLRQVADALSALRAAPAPAELGGEAAAMAEFSAFAQSRGPAHTLVLSAPPPDVARKPRARHRGSRGVRGMGGVRGVHGFRGVRGVRGVRPPTWRAGALMGVAAAAVIVMIVAFGGFLPGPIKDITEHPSTSSPPVASSAASASASQSMAAKSAAHDPPTHAPRHSAPARPATTAPPDGRTLCRAWFADFGHPLPHSRWPALWQAFTYCAPYVRDMLPHGNLAVPRWPLGPGPKGPGQQRFHRRF